METIAENLQILVNEKQAIKQALENQGKEPTDKIATYSRLIDELENPDKVVYLVTPDDGTTTIYAQLVGQEKVDLNATPNDIRIGMKAVTNSGVVDGEKDIPAYFSRYGTKKVSANKEATITGYETDYKEMLVTIATFDSSISNSTVIKYVSIDDAIYEVGTGTKVSNISKDIENEQVSLGIIVKETSVLRFFLVREEV